MKGKFLFRKIAGVIVQKIKGFEYYLVWRGVKLGKGNSIYSDITTTESYLITIGNKNTISTNVVFITHDNAIITSNAQKTDVFGEIHIGNNCFIGTGSIIMPGVSLADNTIVAAGSVVVKSINESGIIVGGNPAKKIGTTADYYSRMDEYAINIDGLSEKQKKEVISKCRHIKK